MTKDDRFSKVSRYYLYENPPNPPLLKGGTGGFSCFVVPAPGHGGYTVDPAFATSSRPRYAAGGGYSGSTFTVGLNKTRNPFILNAFVSLDYLKGAVFEESPLVKTQYSWMCGFTVSWIFLKSSERVQKKD